MAYKHLTEEQRKTIAIMLQEKFSYSQIAKRVNVSVSTISREIKRNTRGNQYDYKKAQERADKQNKKVAKIRLKTKSKLIRQAIKLLKTEQWSPRQISGYFAREGKELSHETIYKIIRADKQNGGELYKHCRQHLKYCKRPTSKSSPIIDRTPISQRPPEADGTRFGDWEMDTIVEKNDKWVILTLVERSTDFCIIKRLPQGKDPTELAKTVIKLLYPYRDFVHTITTDNGLEFTKHQTIAERLETTIYFADPYSSWQIGNIENINKLIRQYIPKQTDIEDLDDVFLKRIANKLNSRPREKLNFKTPKECFLANLHFDIE